MTLESGARATVEPGEAPAPGSQGGPHTEQTAVNNSGIINQPAGFKGDRDPVLSHCTVTPPSSHVTPCYGTDKQNMHSLEG